MMRMDTGTFCHLLSGGSIQAILVVQPQLCFYSLSFENRRVILSSFFVPHIVLLYIIFLDIPTCEPVFGVAAVAFHPGERQRGQVVDGPVQRRHRGVSAA